MKYKKEKWPGAPYPNAPRDFGPALNTTLLDEQYSKAAAKGDKLEHLSKKKRQQIRGVDSYKCTRCGNLGSPWQINLWTKDLDTVEEDIILNGCKCGGTVILVDD